MRAVISKTRLLYDMIFNTLSSTSQFYNPKMQLSRSKSKQRGYFEALKPSQNSKVKGYRKDVNVDT